MQESTDKDQEKIIIETEPYTIVVRASIGPHEEYNDKPNRWMLYSYIFNGEEWGIGGYGITHQDQQAVLDHVRATFQHLEIHFQNILRSSIETLINEGSLRPQATELFDYIEPPEKWVKEWSKKLLMEQKKRLHLPQQEGKGGSEHSMPRHLRQRFADRARLLYPYMKKAHREYKQIPPTLRRPEIIVNSDYGQFISPAIVALFEQNRPTDLTLMQVAEAFEWKLSLATLWKYYREFYKGFEESKVATESPKLKGKK